MKLNKYLVQLVIITFILIQLSGCAVIGIATTATTGMMIADERTTGDIIDDNLIKTKIRDKFLQKDFNDLFAKISVNCYEGRVMLTGTVPEEKYVEQAVKLTWLVRGVKEVINEIQVSKAKTSTRAIDTWITTQVKAKFLLTKELRSINYVVEVHDKVVYLLGVAQNQDAIDQAIEIASKIKGVDKVVNHIIAKNDIRRQGGVY